MTRRAVGLHFLHCLRQAAELAGGILRRVIGWQLRTLSNPHVVELADGLLERLMQVRSAIVGLSLQAGISCE